jgi:hypothetical protein
VLAAGDLNGDGDVDLVSGGTDSVIGWYENLGSGAFGARVSISNSIAGARGVGIADIDGDLDLDVYGSSQLDSQPEWFENTNGLGMFSPHTIGTGLAGRNLRPGDIDGDGIIDMVYASEGTDQVVWYRGLGSPTFAFALAQTISITVDAPIIAEPVDLDLDGDLDLIVTSANDDQLSWYENVDGLGTFGAKQVIAGPPALDTSWWLHIADIDSDGDPDAVMTTQGNDTVAWFENRSPMNPLSDDTDGDNLLDAFEITFGFDPTDGDENADSVLDGMEDSDNDGLDNEDEQARGTSPISQDSDLDGLGDGVEVDALFTDPALADTDGDGTDDDIDNCRLIANPLQDDTDSDGRGNGCDAQAAVDLSDPTTRTVIVQFELSLEPTVVGVTFDDHQIHATYSDSGPYRQIVIPGAEFRQHILRTRTENFGLPSDYTIVIDPLTGDLVSASWFEPTLLFNATATSSAVGGLSFNAGASEPFFCITAIHGPCDAPIATSVYDPTTGAIAGLGGVDDPFLDALFPPPLANDLLNPFSDFRLAEMPEPLVAIGFEDVALPGTEEVLGTHVEGGFVLTPGIGPDLSIYLSDSGAPGVGVAGSDFAYVENAASVTLTRVDGGAFNLESIDVAQPFGVVPDGTVTITGTRVGGSTVQMVVPAMTDVWSPVSFGEAWFGLARVQLTSNTSPLAVDNIEVINLPEPDGAVMLLAGVGALLLLHQRRRRAEGRRRARF